MTDIEVGRFALRTFRLSWNYPRDQLKLQALTRPITWENGVCEATCIEGIAHGGQGIYAWGGNLVSVTPARIPVQPHDAPQEDCSCGIYGTLDLGSLMRQYRHHARHLITIFAAEGITIIGPKGLRTERARVVAYWTPAATQTRWKEALPEAKFYPELPDMLTEYHLPIGNLSRANASRLSLPLPSEGAMQ